MKKKLKDLTLEECMKICKSIDVILNPHIFDTRCYKCPLIGTNKCVKTTSRLESEVEVDE